MKAIRVLGRKPVKGGDELRTPRGETVSYVGVHNGTDVQVCSADGRIQRLRPDLVGLEVVAATKSDRKRRQR